MFHLDLKYLNNGFNKIVYNFIFLFLLFIQQLN